MRRSHLSRKLSALTDYTESALEGVPQGSRVSQPLLGIRSAFLPHADANIESPNIGSKFVDRSTGFIVIARATNAMYCTYTAPALRLSADLQAAMYAAGFLANQLLLS